MEAAGRLAQKIAADFWVLFVKKETNHELHEL
jgi:hypothetical protein